LPIFWYQTSPWITNTYPAPLKLVVGLLNAPLISKPCSLSSPMFCMLVRSLCYHPMGLSSVDLRFGSLWFTVWYRCHLLIYGLLLCTFTLHRVDHGFIDKIGARNWSKCWSISNALIQLLPIQQFHKIPPVTHCLYHDYQISALFNYFWPWRLLLLTCKVFSGRHCIYRFNLFMENCQALFWLKGNLYHFNLQFIVSLA